MERWPKSGHKTMAINLILMNLAACMTPLMTTKGMLILLMIIQGFTFSMIITAAQTLLLANHDDDSVAPWN